MISRDSGDDSSATQVRLLLAIAAGTVTPSREYLGTTQGKYGLRSEWAFFYVLNTSTDFEGSLLPGAMVPIQTL